MKDMLDKIFPKRTSPKKMKLPKKANNILDLFPKQKSSIGTKVFPKKAITPKPLRMKPFILGDFITKPQKKAMRKDPFSDWDGDRVINGLDCQPNNPKKHMAYVDLNEYGKSEHVSKFGFDPEKTIVHGTSYDNAEKIQKSKMFNKGTFTYPGRGGFEDASNWAKNKFNDKGVVIIAEADKPIHDGWNSWGTVGSGREERRHSDNMFSDPIHLKKVKILHIKDNILDEDPPMLGDHITKEQCKILNSGQDRFVDSDNDKVIDGLDCQPNNPKKHMAYSKTIDLNPNWVDRQIVNQRLKPSKPGSSIVYIGIPEGALKKGQLTDPQESEVIFFKPNLDEGSASVKIRRPYEEISDKDTALEYMEDHSRLIVSPEVGNKLLSHISQNYAFKTKRTRDIIEKNHGFMYPESEDEQGISISEIAKTAVRSQGLKPISDSPYRGAGRHHEYITKENINKLRGNENNEPDEDIKEAADSLGLRPYRRSDGTWDLE